MTRMLIAIDGSESRRGVRKQLKRARRSCSPVTFVAVCSSSGRIDEARMALESPMAEAKRLGVDASKLLILKGGVNERVGRGDERAQALGA